ncbi:MAG: hypothetical protein KDK36_01895, partial [Leptospiraceae bacterium]|nr:hypothetical protein [Leptospiraceae bacterium]
IEIIQKMFDFNLHGTIGILGKENIGKILTGFLAVIFLQWLELDPKNFHRIRKFENITIPIIVIIIYIAITQLEPEKKDFFYFQF